MMPGRAGRSGVASRSRSDLSQPEEGNGGGSRRSPRAAGETLQEVFRLAAHRLTNRLNRVVQTGDSRGNTGGRVGGMTDPLTGCHLTVVFCSFQERIALSAWIPSTGSPSPGIQVPHTAASGRSSCRTFQSQNSKPCMPVTRVNTAPNVTDWVPAALPVTCSFTSHKQRVRLPGDDQVAQRR